MNIQEYYRKLKTKFYADHKKSNRPGDILNIFLGDDNLVGEIRKTKLKYLVSVYQYKNGVFKRVMQERFAKKELAVSRFREIKEEF